MSLDPMDLKARLAELDDDFKEASADSDDPFALPEPGTYQCILQAIDYFEAKASGDPFLKLIYEVTLDPKYAGRSIEMIYNLSPGGSAEERQRRLGFLKRDLTKLGIDTEAEDFSLGDLYPGSEIWNDVLDAPCELAVVDSKKVNPNTGKPYRNAYLNERLGAPLSDIPSDVPSFQDQVEKGQITIATVDDEIPF